MSLLPKFAWDIDPVLVYYPDWLDFLPGGGIRYYSLLFVFVFLGGYKLLDWQIKRAGGSEQDASDFVLYGVIGVLAGARIGHVLFYEWDHFVDDPTWLFMIHKGGLASHGATMGLILAMWLFCRRKRQSFLEGADRFSYAAALGATLVRLGNFFNSEIVGRKTDQSWGVYFARCSAKECEQDHLGSPIYRHPSQLYEVALGLFVLGALYLWDKKLGEEKRPRGAMISMFFALYFTGRFFIEFVKEYQSQDVLPGTSPLTIGQYLSIIPAALGYYGLYWSHKHRIPAYWYSEETAGEEDEEEDEEGDEDEEEGEGDEDEESDQEAEEAAAEGGKDGPKHDPDVDAEFGTKKK